MKKFIALVLVLVMVLSLSTVAFANKQDVSDTLLEDAVNGVRHVVARIFGHQRVKDIDLHFKYNNAYGSLGNTVIDYHDGVVDGITRAIETMAGYIGEHSASNCFSTRMHQGIACCVTRMATVFNYVYSIAGSTKD